MFLYAVLFRFHKDMNQDETKKYVLGFRNIRDFYKSGIWKTFRKHVLEHKKSYCERCWQRGFYKKGKVLHHKKHLREFPELALTESNTELLCDDCHKEEHPEEFKATKYLERWD